jgi:hypothetical protein
VANEEFTFPTQEYPSDFELWLEPDGVIRIRTGMRVTELGAQEARGLGAALIELADLAARTED